MEEEALLPCPFCNTVGTVAMQCAEERGQFVIWCNECCAEGPPADTGPEAANAWNHRSAASSMTVEIVARAIADATSGHPRPETCIAQAVAAIAAINAMSRETA